MTVASTQFPIRDGSGCTVASGGVSVEITARKAAEARQATLVGELNHRMKSLLAVVQSIARNTFASNGPAPDGYDDFAARLAALARAQDLAIRAQHGARVAEIVAGELEGFGDRVELDGPEVRTKASFAQMFALVVHELATNAVKYGALSSAHGQVMVRWCISREAGGGSLPLLLAGARGPSGTAARLHQLALPVNPVGASAAERRGRPARL
jgi:two-component sensor histidine kinase